MLTEEKIQQNKNRFIELVNGISREGSDISLLLNKLEGSDFYIAPASTIYHGSYRGGLCQHCLNVYDELKILLSSHGSTDYSEDSIRIVALFHDFSKMNFYDTYVKNTKVYSSTGAKYDEMGKFDWVPEKAYKVKELSERFIYGNHEMNALYMTQSFIPLSLEEQVAILHHMGGMATDSAKDDIPAIFNKYPLAMYLHLSDMIATYVKETNN